MVRLMRRPHGWLNEIWSAYSCWWIMVFAVGWVRWLKSWFTTWDPSRPTGIRFRWTCGPTSSWWWPSPLTQGLSWWRADWRSPQLQLKLADWSSPLLITVCYCFHVFPWDSCVGLYPAAQYFNRELAEKPAMGSHRCWCKEHSIDTLHYARTDLYVNVLYVDLANYASRYQLNTL